jgi:hypothetical protein
MIAEVAFPNPFATDSQQYSPFLIEFGIGHFFTLLESISVRTNSSLLERNEEQSESTALKLPMHCKKCPLRFP